MENQIKEDNEGEKLKNEGHLRCARLLVFEFFFLNWGKCSLSLRIYIYIGHHKVVTHWSSGLLAFNFHGRTIHLLTESQGLEIGELLDTWIIVPLNVNSRNN